MFFVKRWWNYVRWFFQRRRLKIGAPVKKYLGKMYWRKVWRDRFREVDRRVNFLRIAGLPGKEHLLLERRIMLAKRRSFRME